MADPTTTNFGWTLPTTGGDSDSWGGLLNSNWTSADGVLGALLTATGNRITPGGANVSAAAWTTNGLRAKFVGATYTDTSSSGPVAAVYVDAFKAATIAASSATTYTNAYGAYFENPVAGANVAVTNAWALGADSAKINGTLSLGGNIVATSFSAYNTTSPTNVTGEGTTYAIVCDTADFNTGSGYSTSTGMFTAPVTGKYFFYLRVSLTVGASSQVAGRVGLITGDGRNFYSDYVNPYAIMSTLNNIASIQMVATISLTAGQTVTPIVNVNGSGAPKTVSVNGNVNRITQFGGYLIAG